MREATFKQIDVTRAIKGTIAAGMVVYEVIASKDGVRVITDRSAVKSPSTANEWDEVFDDGSEE